MPKVTTTEKLIELVKRSGLVSREDLAAFLANHASRTGGVLTSDPMPFAELLIRENLATKWQLEQILKGKYRGFRLGKYTLKGHLGTGGMSSVYLSEHPIMRRPVAIKVLPKTRVSKSSYLERFELEARAVAALDHPNIVRAYDIDNEGDTHYIVMEYVEGKDFQRIVEHEGPLAYERAADYIAQAATGLQHAHEAGVVHRDIKPANCLIDKTGTVKVLDMGLAKIASDEASLSSVYKDSVVGTADYLAPEQAVNSSRVDSRADVYGLGGTLYFLLTGHAPFPQGTLTERLLKHQKEEPASIFVDRPDAPATLVDICRRMMIKEAENRIQSAADVAQELRQWLSGRGYGDGTTGTENYRIGSSLGNSTATNRFKELANASPPPPPASPTGDTVSAAGGDTDHDEDLTLAPLEDDEHRDRSRGSDAGKSDAGRSGAGKSGAGKSGAGKSGAGKSDAGNSDAGKSDVTDVSPSDLNLDAQVLSQIEEEIGESTSGSLVDLLQNQKLSEVSTSGVVLRARQKETGIPGWAIAAAVAAGLGLLLIILLVAVFVF